MTDEVSISAYKLTWPMKCAKCLGVADTRVTIKTTKITARNLSEATWEIPYCQACEASDRSRPLRFGWFKSFRETFTEHVHAVEYLKLHNSVHFLRFENMDYMQLFLQANVDKRQSDVVRR
jgi:hypothetical protein